MHLVKALFASWNNLLLVIFDIGLVAYVLYRLLLLIRGTRAMSLVNGIIVFITVRGIAQWLKLFTLKWLLDQVVVSAAVALPIVFQPELRRALEQLGRGRLISGRSFTERGHEHENRVTERVIDQVVSAAGVLARNRHGALVVIERNTMLGEYIESGVKIDGEISWQMLTNIFVPNTPLHDGAVIIRGTRLQAAACWLPLAQDTVLPSTLGTRHRAAIGISEQTDAVAVVVSEETGAISVADSGRRVGELDERALREMLTARLAPKPSITRSLFQWGSSDHR